jgi:predicted MPP superfamily phosphohydrolase
MTQALIFYNAAIFVLNVGLLIFFSRVKENRTGERIILIGLFLGSIIFLGAILYPITGFGRLQLLAWGVFLHFLVFCVISSILVWNQSRGIGFILAGLSSLLIIVTVDAFLIEPKWLEVNHRTLFSEKLENPIRIAVVADIQTDHPGKYEAHVLELTAGEEPDLVLLVGDYLQISDNKIYQQEFRNFQEILKAAQLDPPLGIYAVRGNVDHHDWLDLFSFLEITTFDATQTLEIDSITLTGVSWRGSENPNLKISGSDQYHIVFGHSPNYSLGEIEADVLIAGHTHGGQFQLPGIGPLLTLSLVPRNWASGMTEISPDKYLIVSRGIGLERGDAPRMRFFCRPELVILDLEPIP